MNINFGLFVPLAEDTYKSARKRKYAERALTALTTWMEAIHLDQS